MRARLIHPKEVCSRYEIGSCPNRRFTIRLSIPDEYSFGGWYSIVGHEGLQHAGFRFAATAGDFQPVRAELERGVRQMDTSGTVGKVPQKLSGGGQREMAIADLVLIRCDAEIGPVRVVPRHPTQSLPNSRQQQPFVGLSRTGLTGHGGSAERLVCVENEEPVAAEDRSVRHPRSASWLGIIRKVSDGTARPAHETVDHPRERFRGPPRREWHSRSGMPGMRSHSAAAAG